MAAAVGNCVHCGFCLPGCPTYQVLGEEMDSPRGRIILMKEVLEGNLPLADATPYVDRCLGCLACVTACPSGVKYGDLISSFRAYAGERRDRTLAETATRRLIHETLPYPGRFRLAVSAGKLGRPFQGFLPGDLGAMLDLLPIELPTSEPLPLIFPAQGTRRARVALLTGCVQQVLAPAINWATVRVLALNGVEVVIPAGQGCCGALSMHTGEAAQARSLARSNLRAFAVDVDAIITNAAGCGSGMHEYPLLFAGQPEADQSAAFAAKVMDISTFLDQLGLIAPPPLLQPMTIAYHDACHLAHAQGVRSAPRSLLKAIPNLTLVEIRDGDICCGSAGTYNLEQPAIAAELGRRKAANIVETGADAIALGNIGCLTQIRTYLARTDHALPIYHTVQVLDMAYGHAQ
jgi:glycolate oxidase iron-sulfur subunit